MKSNNFELVNPYIEGDFKRVFSGNESIKAAKNCYTSISEYIRNPLPKFYFSLKNIKTGKYNHFMVKEKIKKKNIANFNIEEISINHTKDEITKFEDKLDKFKQKGGRRRKELDMDLDEDLEDSDLDSDSSDYYNKYSRKYSYPYRTDQPILYYWYDPLLYKVNRFYFPHFVLPLSPLVEVNLSSAFF